MRRRLLAVLAVLLCWGCGQSRLTADQLASEERQLNSLANETELFRQLLDAGHLTNTYARGHAHYLREAVDEHAKKLEAPALPGLDAERARAQAMAARVARLAQALP